jgi:translation initiation factor 5A
MLMGDGTSKDDLRVPEGDLGKSIEAAYKDGKELLITVISAMGEEAVRPIYLKWLITL